MAEVVKDVVHQCAQQIVHLVEVRLEGCELWLWNRVCDGHRKVEIDVGVQTHGEVLQNDETLVLGSIEGHLPTFRASFSPRVLIHGRQVAVEEDHIEVADQLWVIEVIRCDRLLEGLGDVLVERCEESNWILLSNARLDNGVDALHNLRDRTG